MCCGSSCPPLVCCHWTGTRAGRAKLLEGAVSSATVFVGFVSCEHQFGQCWVHFGVRRRPRDVWETCWPICWRLVSSGDLSRSVWDRFRCYFASTFEAFGVHGAKLLRRFVIVAS